MVSNMTYEKDELIKIYLQEILEKHENDISDEVKDILERISEILHGYEILENEP